MIKEETTQLLELYKLYVEMADRVSQRRLQTNKFYMTLLSGILVILSFTNDKSHLEITSTYQSSIFFAFGLLGCLICIIWYYNIRSHSQLNAKKFEVIHEMERELPYPLYAREWKLLGEGKDAKKYFQLTKVEKWIPAILALPYLILCLLSIMSFLT